MKKVISGKNEKTYWPVTGTISTWLLMDRFHAVGWLWGVYWTIWALLWIGHGYLIFSEKQIDIFEEKK